MIVAKTTQSTLLSALQSVAGIVERRTTMPVLANVLLRRQGAATQLMTSDLEVQLQTSTGKRYVCRYSLGTRWVEGEEVPYLKTSVTEEDE